MFSGHRLEEIVLILFVRNVKRGWRGECQNHYFALKEGSEGSGEECNTYGKPSQKRRRKKHELGWSQQSKFMPFSEGFPLVDFLL